MPAQPRTPVQSNPILAATEAAAEGNTTPVSPAELPSYITDVALPIKPTPPTRVAPSISSLVESVVDSGNVARAANTKMVEDITTMAVSTEPEQARLAEANRTIALQEAKAELQTQNAVRQMAAKADTVDLLTELAVHQSESMRNAVDQRKKLTELDNITLQDNGPLAAIIASFSRDGQMVKADRADKAVAATGAMIKTVESTTTASANTIAAVSEVRTEATVDAIDTQMQAQATLAKAERAVKLAQTNAKAVNENFKLTVQEVDAINKLNAEQRLALNARTAAAKVNMEEQANEEIARIVNIARQEVGANLITTAQVAGHRALGGEGLAELEADYTTGGGLLEKNPMGTLSVGNTPQQAVALLIGSRSEGLTLDTGRNRAIAATSSTVQTTLGESESVADMPQAEYDKRWNTVFNAKVKADRELIPTGGRSTFSAVPYAILAESAAVQSTPLHKKILEPLGWKAKPEAGHSSTNPMDEQQLLNITTSAVIKGTLTIQEATESINTMFGFAVQHNNDINQYEQLHMLPQDSYNIMATTSRGLGIMDIGLREEPTNLIDPTAVRNLLIKSMTAAQRSVFPRQGIPQTYPLETPETRELEESK